MDDLPLALVEDPTFVVGGAHEREQADDQGDRIFPDEDASAAFFPSDDHGDKDQQTNAEEQDFIPDRDRELKPAVGKTLQLQTKSYHNTLPCIADPVPLAKVDIINNNGAYQIVEVFTNGGS